MIKLEDNVAELIMTEEEKAAVTWFELDDATIGKMVKMGTLSILEEEKQIWWYSAALLLCSMAADANADELTQEITGLRYGDKPLGNWKITLKRKIVCSPKES